MEFTAPLASFIKPLQNVCSLASSASGNEDLSQNVVLAVKDNTLTIRGTNYRIELSYSVEVAAVSEGEILVAANKLRDSLSKLPNAALVSFVCDQDSEDDTDLVVKTGQTTFKIRTRSTEGFPNFDPQKEAVMQSFTVNQGKLKKLIDAVIFCISPDDFRDYLRGMRIDIKDDCLTAFGSDGHRLAMAETTVETPLPEGELFDVILPRPSVAELYKILDQGGENIELQFTKNNFSTSCNGYKLSSKLLVVSNPPNMRGVLPREIGSVVAVSRAMLKSEISKVSVLSSKRVNGVNLLFTPGFLNLRAENSEHEVATSQMPINYQGQELDVTLNAAYVNEVLTAMDSEEVNFMFPNPVICVQLQPITADADVKTTYIISRVVV